MKKIGIIILIILGIAGLAGGGYWWFGSGKVNIKVSPEESKIIIDGQEKGSGTINVSLKAGQHQAEMKLEEYATIKQTFTLRGWQSKKYNFDMVKLPEFSQKKEDVVTMALAKDSNKILYAGEGGESLWEYDIKTDKSVQISDADIGSIEKIKWSPDNRLAFVFTSDGEAGILNINRLDLINQEFHSWGKGIIDAAWSPDGQRVAYAYKPDAEEFSLKISNLQNTEAKIVYNLKQTDITEPEIEWSANGEKLLIVDKDVYSFNIYDEKLAKLTTSGEVAEAHLTKRGHYTVYTTGEKTYIIGIDKKNNRAINQGFDAFTYSGDGQDLYGFKDENFFKVDLGSGKISKLGYNGDPINNVGEMLIAGDDKTLIVLEDNEISTARVQAEIINLGQ